MVTGINRSGIGLGPCWSLTITIGGFPINRTQKYQKMKTLLGRDYFYHNMDSRIRSTRGFVYLKVMGLDESYEHSIKLRKSTENI